MTKEEVIDIINRNRSNFSKIIKTKDGNFYNFIADKIIGVNFSERLYKWLYGSGKCLECNRETKFDGIHKGYREFCSNACVNKSVIIKKRIESSFIEKFGVSNVSQNIDIKNKKKTTFLSKYGVGVESPFDLQDYREKAKVNWRSYYENGKDVILPRLNKKRRESFIKKCITGIRLDSNIKPLFDIDTFTNIKDYNLKFQCKVCNNIFHHHLQWGNKPYCWKCNPNSKLQDSVYQFIFNKKFEIKQNVRNIINGELDIYIPQLKIAIECNGIYWHSIDKKSVYYHLNKTLECEKLGIKLIHIFENEWWDINNNIKTILLNILEDNILHIIESYKTLDGYYIIDRRIFNKCFFINGFDILEEIEPNQCNFGGYFIWNCGFLKIKNKI